MKLLLSIVKRGPVILFWYSQYIELKKVVSNVKNFSSSGIKNIMLFLFYFNYECEHDVRSRMNT